MTTRGLDAGEARRFLRVLYQHVIASDGTIDDDFEVEVRSLAGEPGRKRPLRRYAAGATVDAVVGLAESDLRAGGDVYFGVHLRRRGSSRAGDEAVAAVVAAIADIDCAKHGIELDRALAVVMRHPAGPPSIVVSSGGGLHAYWLYDEAAPVDRVGFGAETAALHRRACAATRAWINAELGEAAADDMSSLDRILRLPGSVNRKPERAVDGEAPRVELLHCDPTRFYAIDDFVEAVAPAGFDEAAHSAAPRRALDPESLPTTLPRRVAAALAALPGRNEVRRVAGRIAAIKLYPCPACGQGDGGCFLSPSTGRLRSYHQASCPAGGDSGGIGLSTWAARYLAPGWDADLGPSAEESARAAAVAGRVASESVFDAPSDGLGGDSAALAGLVDFDPDAGWQTPLRDGSGAVRAWHDDSGRPAPGSFAAVDEAVAGGVLAAGNPREALEVLRVGGAIVVTETLRDWRALVGLSLVADLAPPVLAPADPRVFANWLAGELGRNRQGRIHVVGDVDFAEGFAGLGAIVLHSRRGGTVAAIVDDEWTRERLAEQLADPAPPVWRAAPVAIEASGAPLAGLLGEALAFAGDAGRRALAVCAVPPGAGKSTAALGLLGAIAAGTSGRRLFLDADGNERPARVAFFTPAAALAEEKYREFVERGLGPAQLAGGALASCQFADRARPVYAAVGRDGLCGRAGSPERCSLADATADRPACPGATPAAARAGEVLFGPDALAEHLTLDLAVIDEGSAALRLDVVAAAEVATISASTVAGRAAAWRRQHPDAVEAAKRLGRIVDRLAAEHAAACRDRRVDAFDRRIDGDELARVIELDPKLPEALVEGFADDAKMPPTPPPSAVRAGAASVTAFPSRQAFKRLRELADAYSRARRLGRYELAIVGQGEPPPTVALVLSPSGDWSLETRRVRPLPRCAVLLLDATGDRRLDELRAAYGHGRDVAAFRLGVVGERPANALHYAEPATRARLCPGGRITGRGVTTVRRAAFALARETRRVYPRETTDQIKLGLITFRQLAAGMLGADGDPTPAARALAGIQAELAEAFGATLELGWYGRDSRGTNRFEDCHGFALVGDPRPSVGASAADSAALGLDAAAELDRKLAEELIQAIHRPRFTRRRPESGVVVAFVGATDIGRLVPEAGFRTAELPRETVAGAAARDFMLTLALESGVVGLTPARAAGADPDLSDRVLREAAEAVAEHLGFPRFAMARRQGGEVAIYAVDHYAALRWAWLHGGSMRVFGVIAGLEQCVATYLERGAGRPAALVDADLRFLKELQDEARKLYPAAPERPEPEPPHRDPSGPAGMEPGDACQRRGGRRAAHPHRACAPAPARAPGRSRGAGRGAAGGRGDAGAGAVGPAGEPARRPDRAAGDCQAGGGERARLGRAAGDGAPRAARDDAGGLRLGDAPAPGGRRREVADRGLAGGPDDAALADHRPAGRIAS